MNTQDYLNQLEEDRQDLVDNLETKGITGLTGDETFTQLVPEVLNIPSGANLSEYFEYEPTTISNPENWGTNNFIKKMPDLLIPNTTTSLYKLFYYFGSKVIPKVVCGNNVTTFKEMFYGCNKPTEIDVGSLNISNVTTVDSMFYGCTSLINLKNSSNLGSTLCTTFSNMFYNCQNLTTLDLSNLNPTSSSSVVFQDTFYNCRNLTTIDLSNLEKAVTTTRMFENCTSLTKIDMRKMKFANISNYGRTFGGNSSTGPADDCLIIVKDDTQKNWIINKFSRLTNVKTVEEYENPSA